MDSTNRNVAIPDPPINAAPEAALGEEALGEVEAALFQSEALYQTFLEQSPIGIAHLNAAGVVTFENHRLRSVIGEDPDAAWIGRSMSELYGFDARLPALVGRMLEGTTPTVETEADFVRHDGARRVLSVHATPIRHPEHGIVGGVLMVADVTAERERDAELRLLRRYDEAEPALHHAVLSQASGRAFLHDAVRILGETARADRAAVLLFDEARGAYTESHCWSREPGPEPEAPGFEAESLPESRADRAVLPLGAGQGGALVVTRTPSWTETERVALGRLGVLVETLWAGMRAEARYREVVASLDDCLFSFSFGPGGERSYSFLSEQIDALTGYRADDLLAGACPWQDAVVHPDDRAAVEQHDRALSEGREGRLVYRIRTAGGAVRWLRESAAPRRDHTGRTVVAGILSDVTEARETEAALVRTKQDAASATRAKSSFLSMMSHEIRTPLGSINGFAELLLEEVSELDDPPPVIAEFATTIREASSKVLRLINDIFDLATLQSGRVDVTCAPVPLHPVIRSASRKYDEALTQRGVALVLDLDADAPIVLGEAGRIGQVLEQLLSNASKFTDEGHVRIATEAAEGAVRLRVEDTGVGVAPEYVESMFEPFSQGDNRLNRDYEGSGLGLALVRRLVEAMNGTVTAASVQGEGTAFEITLPRADG